MNFATVEKIADAVLYEGYILYPYRPSSIKNQQRWNFGTLYPRDFAEVQNPQEAWAFHAEVLLEGGPDTKVDARVRFLQLVPADSAKDDGWDEGFARSRTIECVTIQELCGGIERRFDLSSMADEEKKHAPSSFCARSCIGVVTMHAENLAEGLYRVTAEFSNQTPVDDPQQISRKTMLARAFTSAHLLLQATGGAFVSALDPKPELVAATSACINRGVFPVLAGEEGDCGCMLCSPIILYDYPQIAPESTGDFFDGTEMDEMLALRVMTLTESEQDEMRRSDPHARAILERLETLPKEHLLKVHGAVRGMSTTDDVNTEQHQQEQINGAIEPWNPFEERAPIESVGVFGVQLRTGDRVRLWPQKKADIIDMAMEGKVAVIESIEQDLEDNIQFAVVLDDDPGRDMGLLRQAGHRFFFSPEEVEPLSGETQ